MGVPGLLNWLKDKYPNLLANVTKDNRFQCDYFYLDMNGIIHPCCHPPPKLQSPKNEQEMIVFMQRYLDMILEYIEPKELLFIAVDGPPPRAKMMQQRERRFIKDHESKQSKNTNSWDSNQITPGTKFMQKVTAGLIEYIEMKFQNPTYKNLKIILSDSTVPGEGEHKILDFIRNKRFRGQFNCNDIHLLFSNDSDMILLSLLLHENNTYIMRDVPLRGRDAKFATTIFDIKFNIMDLQRLKKYIICDLSIEKIKYKKFQYDIDRVIDDFVFLSYFLGNDFIPGLPFMNVRDGAYEYLLQKYIGIATNLPSYLTNGSEINFDSVCIFLHQLAKEEANILKYRSLSFRTDHIVQQKLKESKLIDTKKNINNISANKIDNLEMKQVRNNSMNDAQYIGFGDEGYKHRYYKRKFKQLFKSLSSKNIIEIIDNISFEYICALSWIQYYYYSGVISWKWFYKQHYAPLVSDLWIYCKQNNNIQINWRENEKGKPLSPLTQCALLMPRNSAKKMLPTIYFDAIFGDKSVIKEYYPDSFELDLNFKSIHWESIALLNHVNVDVLQEILMDVKIKNNGLDKQYKELDIFGHNCLFMKNNNKQDLICKSYGIISLNSISNNNINKIEMEIPNVLEIGKTFRKCAYVKNNNNNNKMEKKKDEIGDIGCFIKTLQILNVDVDESNIGIEEIISNTNKESFIISESDEELLILIEFKMIVELRNIRIYSFSDSAPKDVNIYHTKHLNLNFDDIKTIKANKCVKCLMKKLKSIKGYNIDLKQQAKNTIEFKNTQFIAIYILSNQNNSQYTNLSGIKFEGNVNIKEEKKEEKKMSKDEMNIISQTMCKYFMSGRPIPHNILKFMQHSKRKHLWKQSVDSLRKSTEYFVENRISKAIEQYKGGYDPKYLFKIWCMNWKQINNIFKPVLDSNILCNNMNCGHIHSIQNNKCVVVICHFNTCNISDQSLVSLSITLKSILFDLYRNLMINNEKEKNKMGYILLQLFLDNNNIETHYGLSILLNMISYPLIYVECLSLSGNIINEIGGNLIQKYLFKCKYLPHRINLYNTKINNKILNNLISGMVRRQRDKIKLIDLENKLKIIGEINKNENIICGEAIDELQREKLYVPLTIFVDKLIDIESLVLNSSFFICTGADYGYVGHGKCNQNYCAVSAIMCGEEEVKCVDIATLPTVHLFVENMMKHIQSNDKNNKNDNVTDDSEELLLVD